MKAHVLLLCLAGSLCGCSSVYSLNPLCTKENMVFEEKLLGTWVEDVNDPDGSYELKRLDDLTDDNWLPKDLADEQQKLYRLTITHNKETKGSLVACLVRLDGRLFLDVFPDKFPSGEFEADSVKLPYNAAMFTPLHTFVRLDLIGDDLKVRTTPKEVEGLLKAEPPVVKVEWLNDRPVLTGSKKEVQAFILKYADDERLFSNETVLVRKSK